MLTCLSAFREKHFQSHLSGVLPVLPIPCICMMKMMKMISRQFIYFSADFFNPVFRNQEKTSALSDHRPGLVLIAKVPAPAGQGSFIL